jgi:hypothetical protein
MFNLKKSWYIFSSLFLLFSIQTLKIEAYNNQKCLYFTSYSYPEGDFIVNLLDNKMKKIDYAILMIKYLIGFLGIISYYLNP